MGVDIALSPHRRRRCHARPGGLRIAVRSPACIEHVGGSLVQPHKRAALRLRGSAAHVGREGGDLCELHPIVHRRRDSAEPRGHRVSGATGRGGDGRVPDRPRAGKHGRLRRSGTGQMGNVRRVRRCLASARRRSVKGQAVQRAGDRLAIHRRVGHTIATKPPLAKIPPEHQGNPVRNRSCRATVSEEPPSQASH